MTAQAVSQGDDPSTTLIRAQLDRMCVIDAVALDTLLYITVLHLHLGILLHDQFTARVITRVLVMVEVVILRVMEVPRVTMVIRVMATMAVVVRVMATMVVVARVLSFLPHDNHNNT